MVVKAVLDTNNLSKEHRGSKFNLVFIGEQRVYPNYDNSKLKFMKMQNKAIYYSYYWHEFQFQSLLRKTH